MRLRTDTIVLVAMLATACSTAGPAGPIEREQHTIERGEATRARVEVDMSAGDLTVTSGARQLLEGSSNSTCRR